MTRRNTFGDEMAVQSVITCCLDTAVDELKDEVGAMHARHDRLDKRARAFEEEKP